MSARRHGARPARTARSVWAGLAAVTGIVSLATGTLVLTYEPAVVAESFGPTATAGPARQVPAPDAPGAATADEARARSSAAASRTGRAPTARRPVPVPPQQVSFGEAEVSADLVPVGVLASGALQIPHDPAKVGWWAAGAVPGDSEGSVVLAGRMDGLSHAGAMSVLLDVEASDSVTIQDRRGDTHRYRVTSCTTQPRQSIDPMLFTTDGSHRLVLITCGGTYDEQAGQYTDNIVVTARPVSGE